MTNGNEPINPCEVYIGINGMTELQTGESSLMIQGLTKREYFAAMAMQGLVTDSNLTYDTVAEFSVMMADKLISELNKTN